MRIFQTVEKQVNDMWREFWRQAKGRRMKFRAIIAESEFIAKKGFIIRTGN